MRLFVSEVLTLQVPPTAEAAATASDTQGPGAVQMADQVLLQVRILVASNYLQPAGGCHSQLLLMSSSPFP